MRLDPLRLRDRLPRAWVERCSRWGALRAPRGRARGGHARRHLARLPGRPADDATSLDWLAVCRGARG
jgi:hypothetical protein